MKTSQLGIGKYVIIDNMPVLFPVEIMHSDVVKNAQSAGFFLLRIISGEPDVYCWGESTSLGIKSAPADTDIIREFIRNLSMQMQPFPAANTQVAAE